MYTEQWGTSGVSSIDLDPDFWIRGTKELLQQQYPPYSYVFWYDYRKKDALFSLHGPGGTTRAEVERIAEGQSHASKLNEHLHWAGAVKDKKTTFYHPV